MKLEYDPCFELLNDLPSNECQLNGDYWLTRPCLEKWLNTSFGHVISCSFIELGAVEGGSINRTVLSSWFGRTGDLEIMAMIQLCEDIGENFSLLV